MKLNIIGKKVTVEATTPEELKKVKQKELKGKDLSNYTKTELIEIINILKV